MSRSPAFAILLAATVALAGCVPLEPHRYLFAKDDARCTGDAADGPACRHAIVEHTDDYDLHFVEFDDQGLQYPDRPPPASSGLPDGEGAPDCDVDSRAAGQCAAWAYQINHVVRALNRLAENRKITLLVFIHGWKHDANADDENVKAFRRLLGEMASIEGHRQQYEKEAGARVSAPRRVVGLYVSWRGESIDVPFVDNLTFWSRKTSAMHVAEGSSRELFARLRAFKCQYNALPTKAGGGVVRVTAGTDRGCALAPARDDNVKVMLIGHSFGGLILYNSLSGSLIESMTRAFDADAGDDAKYWRFADLAVLVNPAFEATRYAPLARIAGNSRYGRYEPPLLVTVTSTTDTATGFWFEVGRFANTLFERHASAEEKRANRETVGHHPEYLTHRLELTGQEPPECEGWQAPPRIETTLRTEDVFQRDLPREYNASRAFFRRDNPSVGTPVYRLNPGPWARDFCGGVRLTLTGGDPNNPIWNVSAIGAKDLLPDHSDIGEPRFIAFIRQLYLDTIFLDLMVSPTSVPAKVPP